MNISFLKEKGNKYLIFVLLGILVLVLCIPTGSVKDSKSQEMFSGEEGELEAQLKNVLSAMEGVGEVEVMITTETTNHSLFETQRTGGKVQGVVVVAQGAGNASVDARISEAVKALFSVDAHKISIVKMRSQEGNE